MSLVAVVFEQGLVRFEQVRRQLGSTPETLLGGRPERARRVGAPEAVFRPAGRPVPCSRRPPTRTAAPGAVPATASLAGGRTAVVRAPGSPPPARRERVRRSPAGAGRQGGPERVPGSGA